MDSRHKPRARSWLAMGLLSPALLLVACGGQIPFSGNVAVAGDPPPLPPPPPPPKVQEPPKPPPRVEVRDNKIEITEKIQFEVAKATIKPESFSLLDEIVQVFKDNPHILLVAIEGHASKEGSAVFNRNLSDARAKAVRQYLVDHGIAETVLTAKGYGFDKPIADNETEEGREKNRRVEFNILKQDVTKKKVEIDPTTGKERVVEEKTSTQEKPEAAAPATPGADPKAPKGAPAVVPKKTTDKTPATGSTTSDKPATTEKKPATGSSTMTEKKPAAGQTTPTVPKTGTTTPDPKK